MQTLRFFFIVITCKISVLIYFWSFPENRVWHFMHIVSKPVFLGVGGGERKNIQSVCRLLKLQYSMMSDICGNHVGLHLFGLHRVVLQQSLCQQSPQGIVDPVLMVQGWSHEDYTDVHMYSIYICGNKVNPIAKWRCSFEQVFTWVHRPRKDIDRNCKQTGRHT